MQITFRGGRPASGFHAIVVVVEETPGLSFAPGAHPGVTKHVLQDTCPVNGADHASIYADPQTLDLTLNALDPDGAVTPRCTATMPVIGMPGEVPPRG